MALLTRERTMGLLCFSGIKFKISLEGHDDGSNGMAWSQITGSGVASGAASGVVVVVTLSICLISVFIIGAVSLITVFRMWLSVISAT